MNIEFLNYPAIRQVDSAKLGSVLADIESHMPAGHAYKSSDLITWAHETTHGINSNIRNKYGKGNDNGFYCLLNRAIVIPEPNTTIRKIAANVSPALRGGSFELYMVKSASDWNNQPLYVFDEWTAYTNGAACGLDLISRKLFKDDRSFGHDILSMLEFSVYATATAYTIKQEDSNYNDAIFRSYYSWNFDRVLGLYEQSKTLPEARLEKCGEYLERLKSDKLFGFMKTYLDFELEDYGTTSFL